TKIIVILVAFGIAVFKAVMVIANFMHLRFEPRLMIGLVGFALFVLLALFFGVWPDVLSEGNSAQHPSTELIYTTLKKAKHNDEVIIFTDKDAIPEKIEGSRFNSDILAKITNEDDKEVMKSSYGYKKDVELHVYKLDKKLLNTNLTNDQKEKISKISNILKSVKYELTESDVINSFAKIGYHNFAEREDIKKFILKKSKTSMSK
ncbi:MAG: cytochrome C oxidase subunit IV family protein, partial [Spirochaetota bacterium]|nr:cytochrome C oxidase subunit IV family protein [Spirochaetota bacterium]